MRSWNVHARLKSGSRAVYEIRVGYIIFRETAARTTSTLGSRGESFQVSVDILRFNLENSPSVLSAACAAPIVK